MKRWSTTAVLVLFALCAGRAGAAPSEVAASAALTPWQPGTSYQGDAQYDARIDKPVQEWRAGVPLKDLLADLTKQTGVAFAFSPAASDEARACYTLYLNPQQPPSLRDVMVQLSWVTGCAFAYSEGPADSRTYLLLGTVAGEEVAAKLAAAIQAQRAQFRADMQSRGDTRRATTASALEESKRALALSPQDAAARYRGTNDALLLNLLDPSRRAALAFLTSLPDDDAQTLLSGRGGRLSRDWSAWSPDQQAALKQALGGGQDWPTDGSVTVRVDAGRGGSIVAMVRTDGRPRILGRVRGMLATGDLRPDQEATLRGYLGEPAPPPAATAAAPPQDRQAARAARQEQARQQQAQAQAAVRALSKGRTALLTSLSLPEGSAGSDLWELQEALAKATGLNVISDCSGLAPNRFGRGGPGGRSADPAANFLEALDAFCVGPRGGFGGPFGGLGDADLSLRWGDAGDFLRFRAAHPEIWHAAMLPPDVLSQLDGWLAPYLEGDQTATDPLRDDPDKMSWLAGHLNDLQVRLGGSVAYTDLSDQTEVRRQALRRATLQQLGRGLPIFRLLSSLTPKQWERLRGAGLKWGYDLTPEQQSSDLSSMLGRGVPDDRVKDLVVQLGQADAQTVQGRGGDRTLPAGPALTLLLDGQVINQLRLGQAWPGGGRRGG